MGLNPEMFKDLVLAVLLMILVSLGTALYHLTAGKGDSGKMLKALTWRISLSVALLLVLAIAGHFGWFTPHDFGRPLAAPTTAAKPDDKNSNPSNAPAALSTNSAPIEPNSSQPKSSATHP